MGMFRFTVENRYGSMFPDLRVVSNHTLHVIKYLRSVGQGVVVEPDDGRPLAYTTEKGGGFLADPTIAFLAGIPVSIASSLLANWLSNRKRRDVEHASANVIFVALGDSGLAGWNIHAERLQPQQLQLALSAGRRSAEIFYQSRLAVAPDPEHPLPIQLEHSGRVVAWASNLEFNDDSKSIKVVGIKIVDPVVEEAVRKRELTGFSVAGVAAEATCEICNQQYVTCDHIATEWYGNKRCSVRITKFLLADISIVSDPVNQACRITY